MSVRKSSLGGTAFKSVAYVPSAGGAALPPRVGMDATGGTIEDFVIAGKTYRSHTFTSSGTFSISNFYSANTDAELVVAAGGGSNATGYVSCGAGGGGVLYYGSMETAGLAIRTITGSSLSNLTASSYTVTVGGGGAAGASATGGTSSFVGTNYNIFATGGGVSSIYDGNTYNAGNVSGSGYSDFQGRGGGTGGNRSAGGGGAFPDNASEATDRVKGQGGMGCMFRYIKPGGLFVGGGGQGGFGTGAYGNSLTRSQRGPQSGSGGASGSDGAPNSAGGAGGQWNDSGSKAGGSGVVVIKYRIY